MDLWIYGIAPSLTEFPCGCRRIREIKPLNRQLEGERFFRREHELLANARQIFHCYGVDGGIKFT